MKLKGILLTSALTTMLGVGVFAGVSANRSAKSIEIIEAYSYSSTDNKIFFNPGVWDKDNDWFAAYFFIDNPASNTWVRCQKFGGSSQIKDLYYVEVPSSYYSSNLIFVRKSNSNQNLNWNDVHNQTSDIKSISSYSNNYYEITGWNNGDFSNSTSIGHVEIVQNTGGTFSLQHNASIKGTNYYYTNQQITLNATADTGYVFDHWESYENSSWVRFSSNATTNPLSFNAPSGYNNKYRPVFTDLSTRSVKVVGASNGLWEGGDEDISINLAYQTGSETTELQYYNTSVSLTAGTVFKIKDITGGNAYYGWNQVNPAANSAAGKGCIVAATSGGSDKNIKVVTGGSYEIYYKPNASGTDGNYKLWIQVSSQTEAENWAAGFVTGVGCSATYNAAPTNWNTYATSYAALTDGAKNIIYGTTGSNAANATNIEKAVFMYDMSVRKYNGLSKFMVNSSGQARNSGVVVGNLPVETSTAATIAATVVVSIVALSTAAGFLFLKKKKISVK